jgi:UDP-GlcNAc:undecaprenyl-phosphate/decaprenyl-phosphate GlcNAc-1-phosphate transferase
MEKMASLPALGALVGAGALALLLNAAITPLVLRIAHRRGWFDQPGARKIHTDPTPRLGGMGIFISFFLTALAAELLFPALLHGPWTGSLRPRSLALFGGFLVIHGVGLVDDFWNLPALAKLCAQVAAAALVTLGGYTFPLGGSPGSLSVLAVVSWVVTVVWIVGISNAMNLVDGVDGLAGGIACLAALATGIVAVLQGTPSTAVLAVTLFGAVAGFLIYNFPPARIFMGDSGSLLLGFTLACLPLVSHTEVSNLGAFLAPLTVLTIPILDTAAAILRRVRRRQPIHMPDKEHIHHMLLALGMKERTILAAVYGYCALLGAAAVVASLMRWEAALATTAAAWTVSIGAYVVLSARGRKAAARE